MIFTVILLFVILFVIGFVICLGMCQTSNLNTTNYDKQLNDEIQMAYLSNL